MFTLTLSIKGVRDPVVLGFDTLALAAAQIEKLKAPESGEPVHLTDDYGQVVCFNRPTLVCMNLADEVSHAAMKYDLAMIKMKARNDFQIHLTKNPDLKFLVGKSNPRFDRKPS